MEGLIKTEENGHYNDTVRATYQDLVMMGVGINNIEKAVRTVLTNFTNMDIECLPKATFARLMYTESRRLSQLQVAESLLKDYDKYRSRTFTINRTAGKGRRYLFNSSLPLPSASQTLNINQAITAESSPLHIASNRTRTGNLWFPSASR